MPEFLLVLQNHTGVAGRTNIAAVPSLRRAKKLA
jgi:hypothetical protein